MKKNLLWIFPALLSFVFFSCDEDDDLSPNSVPEGIRSAFHQQFPSAQRVEWEKEGIYYVADFWENDQEASAWFDPNGSWRMTEIDIPYNALPEAVRAAFEASEYANWKKEDIERIDRKDFERLYKIEVEQGDTDVDLYYNTEGILVKKVVDNDGQKPSIQPIPDKLMSFIQERYPNAQVLEMEIEHSVIEIDLIHNKREKEAYFNLQYQWLYTSYDLRKNEVPEFVTLAITNSPDYAGYRIDDAEYIETPSGDHYLLELEKGEREIKVKVDLQGKIIA